MTPCLLLEPRAVPETSEGFAGFGRFQRLRAQPFAPEARGKSQNLRRWVGVGRVEKT